MLTSRVAAALRSRAARCRGGSLASSSASAAAAGSQSAASSSSSSFSAAHAAPGAATICTAAAATAAQQRINLRAHGMHWQIQHAVNRAQLQQLQQQRHFATAGAAGAKADAKSGAEAGGRTFGGQDEAGQGQEQEGEQQEQQQQQQQQQQQPDDLPQGVTKVQAIVGVALILGGIIGGSIFFFAVAKAAPTQEEIESARMRGEEASWLKNIKDMFMGTQPVLPHEQVDAMGRRPRTLVIGWDRVLVHCEWSRLNGWKVRKRPGVDRFLERAQRAGYEVVLWANMAAFEIEGLVAELDRTAAIKHKLYNEQASFKYVDDKMLRGASAAVAGGSGSNTNAAATDTAVPPPPVTGTPILPPAVSSAAVVKGGKKSASPSAPESDSSSKVEGGNFQLVRDLNRLQRDPRRLLVIDTARAMYAPINDKQNVLRIKPFEDDLKDNTLNEMGDLIENITRYNVSDISSLVSRYVANPSQTVSELFAKERAAEAAAMRKLSKHNPQMAKKNAVGGNAAAQSPLDHDDDDDDEEERDQKQKEEEEQQPKKSFLTRLRERLPGKKKPAPTPTQ